MFKKANIFFFLIHGHSTKNQGLGARRPAHYRLCPRQGVLPRFAGLPNCARYARNPGLPVGATFIGFKQAQPTHPGGGTFTPFNVGLDHIAIACTDEAELHRVADALQAAGVENTGVKQDAVGPMQYVAFKDPDRIAWEFYMV